MTFVWWRNSVREISHISFFCGGDPFCEVVRRPENTHGGADRFTWVASGSPLSWETSRSPPLLERQAGSLPFAWKTCRSLPSVQNYRSYILSQVPCENMNTLVASRFFCLWLVIGTYILPFFFREFVDLICERKCLSFYPPAVNYLSLSCETSQLMLSCDRIESAKFIHVAT